MQTRLFEATVRQVAEATIIDLQGEINRGSEEALNAAYDTASELSAATILMNFSDVAYINSTGIAVIVSILARARRDKRALTVYGLSDHYRTIFEITRLVDFMQICSDEKSAIQEVSRTCLRGPEGQSASRDGTGTGGGGNVGL